MRTLRSLFLTAAVAGVLPAQNASHYAVAHTYPVGGDGSWDYIIPDPARHRIFVGREDRVIVVDEQTGKLLGAVSGIHGAHGVAIVEPSGRGFATSGDDSAVVMFDVKTLKPLGRVHAAEDADAIIFDPASKRVFTFNGDAHSSTVIDAATGRVLTNIDLGGKPEYGASAENGMIYINLTDKSEVVEVDANRLRVLRRWPTSGCTNPVAMAIDVMHERLFSGCRSGVLAVSDYKTGKVVATAPIGAGVDGVAFDPATGDAFAANADGTLTVIHQDGPNSYHVVETVKTMRGSRNVGLDPTTHTLWLAGAAFQPAPATAPDGRRQRPVMVAGSFVLMTIDRR